MICRSTPLNRNLINTYRLAACIKAAYHSVQAKRPGVMGVEFDRKVKFEKGLKSI
jgi:hypothetical protein